MSEQNFAGPQQRVFRRTELRTDVEIDVEDTGEPAARRTVAGAIMDVGVGGMLVRLDESLAEGAACTVRFADAGVGDLEARGHVRRVRSDAEGFLLGIEFERRIDSLRTPSAQDHLEGFQLESTRILVVDDEPSVVELLDRFLTSRGCRVSIAGSGEEALELLRCEPQDITVLDLKMPGIDGLEVLRAIREEKLAAGSVWAVSGYASDAEARAALNEGATDFISKPLDLKYLEWSMQLHRVTG